MLWPTETKVFSNLYSRIEGHPKPSLYLLYVCAAAIFSSHSRGPITAVVGGTWRSIPPT